MFLELAPTPRDDCSRLHDHQGFTPAGPDPGQPSPENAVRGSDPRALRRSLVDGELMAESQDLGLQGEPRPKRREKGRQECAKKETDHTGGSEDEWNRVEKGMLHWIQKFKDRNGFEYSGRTTKTTRHENNK